MWGSSSGELQLDSFNNVDIWERARKRVFDIWQINCSLSLKLLTKFFGFVFVMATNGSTNGHTNGNSTTKRPIRIAGASGGFTDRQRAIADLAKCDVDVIVGDWMSECTMSWHGAAKSAILSKGDNEERPGLFDPSFMANVTPALPLLAEKGIKLAVNAGASDTEMLAKTMEKAIANLGLTEKLKVAWIQGDEVLDVVNKLLKQGEKFENICFGGELKDWGFEPVAAQ